MKPITLYITADTSKLERCAIFRDAPPERRAEILSRAGQPIRVKPVPMTRKDMGADRICEADYFWTVLPEDAEGEQCAWVCGHIVDVD